MDKQQFMEESHKHLDVLFDKFDKSKQIVIEIFRLFHKICQENDIKYYVSCGSLLGFTRDECLLPWDYDFDVSVPITELNKLIEVLKNNLPVEYFFESNLTDKNLPFFQMRIGKKGYDISFIHLDVFYLVGTPQKHVEKFKNKVKNLFMARWKIKENKYYNQKGLKSLLKVIYYKIKYLCFPFAFFDLKFKHFATKYDYKKSKSVMHFSYIAEIFPSSMLGEGIVVNKMGIDVRVPSDPEGIMKIHYGDYKKYLPIEDRFGEFYQAASNKIKVDR